MGMFSFTNWNVKCVTKRGYMLKGSWDECAPDVWLLKMWPDYTAYMVAMCTQIDVYKTSSCLSTLSTYINPHHYTFVNRLNTEYHVIICQALSFQIYVCLSVCIFFKKAELKVVLESIIIIKSPVV